MGTIFPLKEGDNGVNMEGGICQLRDGLIIALETYEVQEENSEEGLGLM